MSNKSTRRPKLWAPYPGEDRVWRTKGRSTARATAQYLEILRVLVEHEGRIEWTGKRAANQVVRDEMKIPTGDELSTRLRELDRLGWISRLVNGRRTLMIELNDIEMTRGILAKIVMPEGMIEEPEEEHAEEPQGVIARKAKEQESPAEMIVLMDEVNDRTRENPPDLAGELENLRSDAPAEPAEPAEPQLPPVISDQDATKVAAFLLKQVLEAQTIGDYSLQRDHLESELRKAQRRIGNIEEDLEAERRKSSRLQAEVAHRNEIISGLERNLNRMFSTLRQNGTSIEEILGERNLREMTRLMKEIPVSPHSHNGD